MTDETMRLVERFELPASVTARLATLLDLLAAPEAPTSVHDPRHAVDIHIADSLSGLDIEAVRTANVIADLGAGAGLPGLVLAAARDDARVVLVESAARKCAYLRRAAAAMELDNAEVVWARAEEWRDGIGRCDAVTVRAVAPLAVLCEYAAPLLRHGGALVAWKGAVGAEEAADARAAAAHLGLAPEPVRDVVPYPGSERRTLHGLRKVAPTPSGYPRRAGLATKRPLSATSLR